MRELRGFDEVELTLMGGTATRVFKAEWDEVEGAIMSLMGAPHPEFPMLKARRMRLSPLGPPNATPFGNQYSHRKITVSYEFNYNDVPLGEEPRVTITGKSEVLNTGAGRVYSDTGEMIDSVDANVGIPYVTCIFTMDCAMPASPTSLISGLVNKVNNAEFAGKAAGTLLMLDDFNIIQQWDYETQAWYHRLTYSLAYRTSGHNQVWRPPMYEPNKKGELPQYYQGKDPAADNYTLDTTLIGRPVYKTGDSGTGAWTDANPPFYTTGDFSGLPAPVAL
jgi:hypothetical protein